MGDVTAAFAVTIDEATDKKLETRSEGGDVTRGKQEGLAQLQARVDELQALMLANVELALQRGDNVDELVVTATKLHDNVSTV